MAAIGVGVASWISATGGSSSSTDVTSPPPATDPTRPLTATPGVATAGSIAPAFDLPRLRAPGSVRLQDLRGKGVIVNFWASWCVPCRREFPLLRAVQRRYAGRGIEIVGIDFHDIDSDARAFARARGATWDLVSDEDRSVAVAYGVRAIPQTFFIAPDGRISQRYFASPPDLAAFDTEIAKILPPAAAPPSAPAG